MGNQGPHPLEKWRPAQGTLGDRKAQGACQFQARLLSPYQPLALSAQASCGVRAVPEEQGASCKPKGET